MKKIAVTGTKGKTTVVRMISKILHQLDSQHVLTVTTEGHYLDEVQKSTKEDSQRYWGLVPSVAPGRYLFELMSMSKEERDNSVAVLECSLGSSTLSGMAYATHNVGIFLNVYEDHIGSSSRVNSQDDILEAKKFIFSRIGYDGWAVGNVDDVRVARAFSYVQKHARVHYLPFGLSLSRESLPEEYKESDYITIVNGWVVYVQNNTCHKIVHTRSVPWTFNGTFTPSLYNLLAVVGGVIAINNGQVPKNISPLIELTNFDRYSGRLTLLKSKSGVTILADYAHEKKSLLEIGKLARTMIREGSKTIGVVRLAYDRTDELIKDTGNTIAHAFDQIIVYDKIDGYLRTPKKDLWFKRFTQETGLVSQKFHDAVVAAGGVSKRIIREDEAIIHAAKISQPGDMVVVIVNDDIKQTLDFIQEAFDADFL